MKVSKKRKKKINFYANEVCYGLAIAAGTGMGHSEAIKLISDDLFKWSELTLPEGEE